MIFKKKTKTVGKHFILTDAEKQKMTLAVNRIIGQLETIKKDINLNEACDESLTQILAIKGGVSRVGLDLLSSGVLDCLQDYTQDELALVFKNMFKLD